MFKLMLFALLLGYASFGLALPFASRYALVIEERDGRVLLSKNADVEVPIASLTKLMTAMVVLDADPDLDEEIAIEDPAVLTKRRTWSRLPLGTLLPRRAVLQLALMSSDNRAAASLAYAYPGGMDGFIAAVAAKIEALGMTRTRIEEPTGLSSGNRSTATDLAKMAAAAASYPEIVRITTDSHDTVEIGGRTLDYRNTNRLVGQQGWDILLSKTGYTTPAGRCLIMRMQAAGQTVIVVLLDARASSARARDALNVRRFVAGEPPLLARASHFQRGKRALHHRHNGRVRVRMQLARADKSD